VETVDQDLDEVIVLEVRVPANLTRPDSGRLTVVGVDPEIESLVITQDTKDRPLARGRTLLRLLLPEVGDRIARKPVRLVEVAVERDSRDNAFDAQRCPVPSNLGRYWSHDSGNQGEQQEPANDLHFRREAKAS
jgi:hypothetical protein